MQPEHRRSVTDQSVTETTITYTGALSVNSGKKTGRVPKEKRIVYDDLTKDVSNKLIANDMTDHLVGFRQRSS